MAPIAGQTVCLDPQKALDPRYKRGVGALGELKARTQNRVIVGLHRDYGLLQARQDLLRLSQRQPQLRDLAEATTWPDMLHIDDPCRTIDPCFNQARDPRHPRTPSHQPIGQSYRLRPHPPAFRTLPRAGFVESAVNQIVDKRFDKRQSMRWTPVALTCCSRPEHGSSTAIDQLIRRRYPAFRKPSGNDIAPIL